MTDNLKVRDEETFFWRNEMKSILTLASVVTLSAISCKPRAFNGSETASAGGDVYQNIIKENQANGRRGGINSVTKKPCVYQVMKEDDFANSKLHLRVDFSSNAEPQFGIRGPFSQVPLQNKIVSEDSGCSGPWCVLRPGTPPAKTRYEIEYSKNYQIEKISYFVEKSLAEQCVFGADNSEYEKVLRANETGKLVVGKNAEGGACAFIVRNDTTFGTDDRDLYVNYYSAEEPAFAGGFGSGYQFARPPRSQNKLVAVDKNRDPISVILNGGPLPETRAELDHDSALKITKIRSFQNNRIFAECSVP
jgi:hypothetical protein